LREKQADGQNAAMLLNEDVLSELAVMNSAGCGCDAQHQQLAGVSGEHCGLIDR